MNKKRTEEEKGRMQSLRNEGKTYKEIAQIMNISLDAVNYFFRKQYRIYTRVILKNILQENAEGSRIRN